MSTTTARVPLTARTQQWADEQAKFEASGLTAREFCQQKWNGHHPTWAN